MTSNPIIWVAAVIALGSLTAWIVQFARNRRGGSARDRGAWWEGPWDEDDKGSPGR
ncbi:hypothetical protein ACTJI8_15815 [Microbacterium sp. 22303]|uniref:hypothetical protein n=1 Tax=Microbacterium sp. 22303 TaxID=3453905 RepID=UPI003F83DCF3